MNWLTSITEIIKAMLWPAVVTCIAFLFKSDFRNVLQSLRSVEVRKDGARAEFKRLRKAAEEEKKEIDAFGDRAKFPQLRFADEIVEFFRPFDEAFDNPRQSVESAWNDLEHTAKRTVERLGIELPEYGGYAKALGDAGIFLPNQQRLFHAMADLRHSEGDIQPFISTRYLLLADLFIRYLDGLKTIPPKWDEKFAAQRGGQ